MEEVKHRGVYGVDVAQEAQWIVYQLEGRWNKSPATAVGSITGMCNDNQATFLKVIWYA